MKKIDFALEAFNNIQDLIKFIDQKSGATLVISGLILTAYFNIVNKIGFADIKSVKFIGVIVFLSSLSTFINIIVVIYLSFFKILKPRLANNYDDNEKSLFYYEHISQLGKEQILNKYNEIDESEMLKYIIDQQYEVSLILEKKTTELNKSFNYLFASIISFILLIISVNLM